MAVVNRDDAEEQLKREQERAAQLESYAADLARTYAELRRHLQHMTVLHEVSTRIASALDPDEVLASMLDSLGQLVTYRAAGVYLLDLDVSVGAHGAGSVTPGDSLPRLRAGRAAERGALQAGEEALAAEDSAIREAMASQQTVAHLAPAGSLDLALPLLAGGRALGALDLQLAQPLAEEDVRVLELLCAAVAVALQNAHLYQETQRLATTDPLTGLSNYRHFHDLLELEVQRARRMDYPVGLLMMDLDHFKEINDRYGHPTGDGVLRRVAEVLRGRLRRTDVVGRLGGEEFGAVLPGASLEEVAIVAEKIRQAVAEAPPPADGGAGPAAVTVSVGGTSARPEAADATHLVSCADQALYEAKNSGRNQVRLWRDGAVATPERLR